MRISEFFGRYFTDVYLARCKKSTRELYRQIVDLWIGEVDDLHLTEITPAHCAEFVTKMMNQPGRAGDKMSPETVAKYCRHLNTIFLKAAKPGYRNRDAFGFINDPPYCKPPKLYQRLPKEVSDRQL
jgi:hypothetical protein